jgi:nucleoside-diphosphate-sugar epimerase
MDRTRRHRRETVDNELCLVTGATGAVGPELVRSLVNAGYRVRALARHVPSAATLPQGVGMWPADVTDGEAMRRAIEGVGTVFHLAARVQVMSPKPELLAEYRQVNVEGTRNAVETCLRSGVRRLVYFSTVSVYASGPGSCADEDAPPVATGPYAETKRAGEEVVLAARLPDSGQPLAVVLRFATIYGPRMKGNYCRLVQALARGRFLPVGDGHNRRTLVFETDAAQAALPAAQHPRAPGRIYNVSDGKTHTFHEILAAICAALGRHPPHFHLPPRPTRWGARAVDRLAGLIGRSASLTPMIDTLLEDVAVRADRIQLELGFRPLVDLVEGWGNTIGAWQKESSSP